jgi:hypothetical protein
MANILPGEFDFPLEDQTVFVGADRKRKLADALRQQAIAPQGQMVGGIYVAPSITQYLASGLKGYQANQLERQSADEVQNAYKNRAALLKGASQKYLEALRPKQVQDGETVQKMPFEANQMDRFGSPMAGQSQQTVATPNMVTKNPTPEDMFNAQIEYAQSLGDPRAMQQAVQGRMNYDIQQQTRQDERSFRSQEAQLQREQRMQEIQLRLQDAQLSRQQNADLRREMFQLQADNQRAMANIAAANRPTGTPVQVMGADGKPVYVGAQDAIGKMPYSAKQEAADTQKAQQQEQARISAQQVLDQAGNLYMHPGRKAGTGATSFVSKIPGTDAKGFQANLDTFKAQTFIPMVSALKGMGALSDAEGKKLAESVGALNPDMKEEEFVKSLETVTKTLYEKARANGLNVQMPDFAVGATADALPSQDAIQKELARRNAAKGRK